MKPKYEATTGTVYKDGHAMFLTDVVKDIQAMQKQLPEEPESRWFLSNNSSVLSDCTVYDKGEIGILLSAGFKEIPEDKLEYVRECLKRDDIAEFEYRLAEENEVYVACPTGGRVKAAIFWGKRLGMVFVRRSPKSHWVECDIKPNVEGFYLVHCQNQPGLKFNTLRLDKASVLHGFGGLQFEEQYGRNIDDGWFMQLGAFYSEGEINGGIMFCPDAKPATPVRARFWVEA